MRSRRQAERDFNMGLLRDADVYPTYRTAAAALDGEEFEDVVRLAKTFRARIKLIRRTIGANLASTSSLSGSMRCDVS
ncbi:hypothetical protein [Sphingomonas sp. CLY1604]|uniref:hypothetical protein n=1 Tax=Sphingomonas sp. CLY1604 TaxID=3457786 RepID=UPI003FD76BE6